MSLQPLENLNQRYQINLSLSKSTMAETYQALDIDTQNYVVIKELLLSEVNDWKSVELFEREAHTLENLNHPRIPQYLDAFQVEGRDWCLYLVMEEIKGKTLTQLLKAGWRPSEQQVIQLAEEILDILIYLQDLQPPVVHRDIKPSNLILDEDNHPYLVDFGSVQKVLQPDGGKTVVGTFGYMAPEQFSGQATPASDLYGLGMTLLHIMTGRPPSELPQSGQHLNLKGYLNCSAPLLAWLEMMTDYHVSKRYASARAALRGLQAAKEGRILTGPLRGPTPKPSKTKLGLGLGLGLVGFLFLGGAVSWFLLKPMSAPGPAAQAEYIDPCFGSPMRPAPINSTPETEAFRSDFEANFPKPAWWNQVEVPPLDTQTALTTYWRCKQRTPEKMFKAAYETILKHSSEDQLVLSALSYMSSAYSKYPQILKLQEFGVDTYFFHQDERVENGLYKGKVGDLTAGLVRDLLKTQNKLSKFQAASDTARRFLDERETEVNHQLLQLISYEYAWALWKKGDSSAALAQLDHALLNYTQGDWSDKLNTLKAQIQG